jgi:hypothetical protein
LPFQKGWKISTLSNIGIILTLSLNNCRIFNIFENDGNVKNIRQRIYRSRAPQKNECSAESRSSSGNNEKNGCDENRSAGDEIFVASNSTLSSSFIAMSCDNTWFRVE